MLRHDEILTISAFLKASIKVEFVSDLNGDQVDKPNQINIMDSDYETLMLLLLLRRRNKKKSRRGWCVRPINEGFLQNAQKIPYTPPTNSASLVAPGSSSTSTSAQPAQDSLIAAPSVLTVPPVGSGSQNTVNPMQLLMNQAPSNHIPQDLTTPSPYIINLLHSAQNTPVDQVFLVPPPQLVAALQAVKSSQNKDQKFGHQKVIKTFLMKMSIFYQMSIGDSAKEFSTVQQLVTTVSKAQLNVKRLFQWFLVARSFSKGVHAQPNTKSDEEENPKKKQEQNNGETNSNEDPKSETECMAVTRATMRQMLEPESQDTFIDHPLPTQQETDEIPEGI
uniref:Uncharacterized protein n=1 Tax=Romanomermis culicivorax TaxID=13658 RepID=A0A915HPS9_ROMCU